MRDIDKVFNRDDFPDYISDSVLTAAKYLFSGLYFGNLHGDEGSFNEKHLTQIMNSGSKEAQENKTNQLVLRYKGFIACLKNSGEYPWKKAARLFKNDSDQGQVWLAAAIYHSFYWPGITGEKPLTEREFEKWRKNLTGILHEAEKLIFNIPPNAYHWVYSFQDDILSEFNKYSDQYPEESCRRIVSKWDIDMGAPWAGYMIQLMRTTLENAENDPLFFRKHINREQSSRDYFVRSLTCAFLQEMGAPYRKVVAEISSAIFNCELSEREVVRISKGVEPSDHLEVVSSFEKMELNRVGVYSDPQYEYDDSF